MIRAIIFDAGGVLFNSEQSLFKSPCEYISQITGESFDKVYTAYRQAIVICESKSVSKEELWNTIMEKLDRSIPFSGQDPIAQGFKEFQPDQEVVDHIRNLRPKYKTALVSNANAVEFSTPQAQALYKSFDVVVLSYQVGVRKPHEKIYDVAFEKLSVEPKEAVFVDNEADNVEEATKLGMVGILFKDAKQLEKDLENVGVTI
ncbi:MAG: HAD family phosphatase [Candidatus Woykebacteria bacterium]